MPTFFLDLTAFRIARVHEALLTELATLSSVTAHRAAAVIGPTETSGGLFLTLTGAIWSVITSLR